MDQSSTRQSVGSRLYYFLTAGLYGGLALALIELIDRGLALQLFREQDWFWFSCALAFIPLGNILLGALLWLAHQFLPGLIDRLDLFGRLGLLPYKAKLIDISERWLSRPLICQLICVAMIVMIGLICWFDARSFVGRYEYYFHWPLKLAAITASFIFGSFVAQWLARQRSLAAALAIIMLVAAIGANSQVASHQKMKAFFWQRGVFAKKYVAAAQILTDFDLDGFSSFFEGGDQDNHNSQRHPLAREIPNNGQDENFYGGDFLTAPADFHELNQRPIDQPVVKNIIFITIDCLRADHLGAYHYQRKLTPNMDQFAERSVLFEHAYSLGTNTGHGFSGIARSNYGEALFDDDIPTAAETLAAHNYNTTAITSPETTKWLWKPGWEKYKTIMLKGFQSIVHEQNGYWNSKKLTDQTIKYLQTNQEKPFYLWIHYNDLHAKGEKYFKQNKNDPATSPIDIYDSNLAFTDKHIGRLLAYLESSGLLNNSAVVISADHGEEFQEHGQEFHNGRLHKEQTHVPLILYYPNVKPTRATEVVTTIDLAPTFLRLAGIIPSPNYVGVSLTATLAGESAGRQIFIETPRNIPQADFFEWAVVEQDWRLIHDYHGNTYELYNDQIDPAEQHNLIDKEPARAQHLKTVLGQWLDLQSQHKSYKYWVRFN